MSNAISIVIRCEDDISLLPRMLEALASQGAPARETVVVDPAARAATAEACRRYGGLWIACTGHPGAALNAGLRRTSGDIAVLLSSRALPLGRDFLALLSRPFDSPTTAAARALNVAATAELREWMMPRLLRGGEGAPEAVVRSCPNDSCCAIRRNVWETEPFNERVRFSADKLWALEILRRGWDIAGSEAMFSYHAESALFRRARAANEQVLAFYEATGKLIEHRPARVGRLLHGILVDGPKAAARVVAAELTAYVSLKTIPLQASLRKRRRTYE